MNASKKGRPSKEPKKQYEITSHPVEKIIGFYSGKEKKKFYRVQWVPSWVPEENLVGCENLIEQFFVDEKIINKDTKDVNSNIMLNKTEIKVEEDYACWENERVKTVNIKDVNNIVTMNKIVDSKKPFHQGTPTENPYKPVTRARMATTPPSIKNPAALRGSLKRRAKLENEKRSSVQQDSSSEDKQNIRKYHTRQYYKDLGISSISIRSRRSNRPKSSIDMCKVYNTRFREKLISTNQKQTSKGEVFVSECVKKLPYGYKNNPMQKSTSPLQRCCRKVAKKIRPADYNGDDFSTNEQNSNTHGPFRGTYINSQSATDIKKEQFSCDEENYVFYQVSRVVKQEPRSPVHPKLLDCKIEPDDRDVNDNTRTVSNMEVQHNHDKNKNRNSPLKKKSKIATKLLQHNDTIPLLKDYSLRYVDKSKSQSNEPDSSSDENEMDLDSAFECDVCEKMFQTSVLLHRHRFIHGVNKPFMFHKQRACRKKTFKDNKENVVRKIKVEQEYSEKELNCNTFSARSKRLQSRRGGKTANAKCD